MYVAIAQFTVPTERDKDFRDWFARSNVQLRETAGLISRRLLRTPDGSYTALVEHENASTFAAMHTAEAISMIQQGLGQILNDSLQATAYDVVVSTVEANYRWSDRDRAQAPGRTSEAMTTMLSR